MEQTKTVLVKVKECCRKVGEKDRDNNLLDNLDGNSMYHSRTYYANYTKKAA